MKDLNIPALNKALFISTLVFYCLLAFGGLISGHLLPMWWHIFFAFLGCIYITVGIYFEEIAEKKEAPSSSAEGQKKYQWGQ